MEITKENELDFVCEHCDRTGIQTSRWMWEGVVARICYRCEDEGAEKKLNLEPCEDDMKRCRHCKGIKRIPKILSEGPRKEKSELYCKECVTLPEVRMSKEGYQRYLRCLRGEEKLFPDEEDNVLVERKRKWLENQKREMGLE